MLIYEIRKNTLHVRLTGELDHSACTRLRPELDQLLSDRGIRRLIFDVTALQFMDSSGIGLLLGRYKLLSRRGGSVAVRGANARMDRVLRMAGVYQVIERLA